jgi:hypothetical protein
MVDGFCRRDRERAEGNGTAFFPFFREDSGKAAILSCQEESTMIK